MFRLGLELAHVEVFQRVGVSLTVLQGSHDHLGFGVGVVQALEVDARAEEIATVAILVYSTAADIFYDNMWSGDHYLFFGRQFAFPLLHACLLPTTSSSCRWLVRLLRCLWVPWLSHCLIDDGRINESQSWDSHMSRRQAGRMLTRIHFLSFVYAFDLARVVHLLLDTVLEVTGRLLDLVEHWFRVVERLVGDLLSLLLVAFLELLDKLRVVGEILWRIWLFKFVCCHRYVCSQRILCFRGFRNNLLDRWIVF